MDEISIFFNTVEWEDVVQHEILEKVEWLATGSVVGIHHLVSVERRVHVCVTSNDL